MIFLVPKFGTLEEKVSLELSADYFLEQSYSTCTFWLERIRWNRAWNLQFGPFWLFRIFWIFDRNRNDQITFLEKSFFFHSKISEFESSFIQILSVYYASQ